MKASRSLDCLRRHGGHDVRALLKGWREAVKGTGFRCRTLTKKDGFPLIQISRDLQETVGGFYASAGIHGDEPAAPWGLLNWFERGGFEPLQGLPILLFPCLNPFGILENLRVDGEGRDLNRLFDQDGLAPVREVRRAVSGREFQLAVCLHEDYDALGSYVYDLNRMGDGASARQLLGRAVTRQIPLDTRSRIDRRAVEKGVIFRRRLDRRNIPGYPEAVFLFLEGHARRTLTFETPSEFSLRDRVEVHRRFLEAAARWCACEKRRRE